MVNRRLTFPIAPLFMSAFPLRTVLALSAAAALAACAPAKPVTAPTPARDPRNNLKAGLFDAGEFTSNLKVVAKVASPNT